MWYRLTGSSLGVGLLGVAERVPLLATAFVGGALCLVGVVLCGALLPRFLRYEARTAQRTS